MIAFLLLAAAVPSIHVPGAAADGYEKVPPPRIEMRTNAASATTVPWIDSNAWRFRRGLGKALYASLPPGAAALAAAEAHAWRVDALLEPDPQDKDQLNQMIEFLRRVDRPALPALVNIAVIDDGSSEIPEVLNLLSRRNLLYRVVKAPDKKLDINIRLGSKQYPREAAKNPSDFAARVREQLGDDKRLVRLFGTYTVLANLTGDSRRARLHLVNYSRRPVNDVRVRVLGNYRTVKLAEAADGTQTAQDVVTSEGGTEFTVPQIVTYAVVDLDDKTD